MCFSNLPVEFDEQGNPYLAEEADAVERPDRADDGEPLDADPEAAYAEILAGVPENVRESLTDAVDSDDAGVDRDGTREAARGD